MPAWVEQGFHEYAKRMPAEHRLQLKEIKPAERAGGKSAATAMAQERGKIEAALPRHCCTVVLDEHGKELSSVQLAEQLRNWQRSGADIAFVIGGADGLDSGIKQGADLLLRLSSLTLPHGLVRVLLAEQLYRAWSITQHHPYHRT